MRRSAAGHDHSTQHVTDLRTRRVFASVGDGYAAIGWDYPGSTLLEVRILRSEHGFAATADDDVPGTGEGAAARAGQTLVYHDLSGSFRDAALRNGRRYFYTVFARHPGGEWIRWGEYELRRVRLMPWPVDRLRSVVLCGASCRRRSCSSASPP